MSKDLGPLLERAKQGEEYTLAEIRDYCSPLVSGQRALELTIRVHDSVQDLTEAERICALVCALMMELI
jgi:hypothetical protein